MTFRFREEDHSYWLGPERLTGVTECLRAQGILADHGATDPYYAERGTAIHEGIKLALLDRLDWATLSPGPVETMVKRALDLVSSLDLQPKLIEQAMFDRTYRIAGRPDLAGYSQKLGQTLVLDWKSGGDDPGYEVQVLGGYAPLIEAAAESGQIDLQKHDLYLARYGAVLLAFDPPRVKWYDHDYRHTNRALFRAALSVYSWRRKKGLK